MVAPARLQDTAVDELRDNLWTQRPLRVHGRVHSLWMSRGDRVAVSAEQPRRRAQVVEENFSGGVSGRPELVSLADRRSAGSADGEQSLERVRLRHVDADEWRYGQAGSPSASGEPATGDPTDASDLWIEDPERAWGSTQPWVPQQRGGASDVGERLVLEPDAWYRPPIATAWGEPRHSAPAASPSRPEATSPVEPTSPYGGLGAHTSQLDPPNGQATADPYGGPSPAAFVGSLGHVDPPTPASVNTYTRAGLDNVSQQAPSERRAVSEEEEYGQRRRGNVVDEPTFGPVLGFTGAWYGVPALLHLLWVVTLDAERQAIATRSLLAGLPWLLGAVMLSLAVAALLRWAIVGWRAVSISFAAAAIGAGVTTIAHSLTV